MSAKKIAERMRVTWPRRMEPGEDRPVRLVADVDPQARCRAEVDTERISSTGGERRHHEAQDAQARSPKPDGSRVASEMPLLVPLVKKIGTTR
jgi:hypothetical protein